MSIKADQDYHGLGFSTTLATLGASGGDGHVRHHWRLQWHDRLWWWQQQPRGARWRWQPREAQVATTVARGIAISGSGGHVRRVWFRRQRRPCEAQAVRVGGRASSSDDCSDPARLGRPLTTTSSDLWLRGRPLAMTSSDMVASAASFGGVSSNLYLCTRDY